MAKMTIKVKEAKEYGSIEEVFQDLGYFPAEDSDDKKLVCYMDFETGIDVPKYVSVITHYDYKADDLLVEVAAGSYDHTTRDGSIGDMFYTFIGAELEHPTFEQVKKACKNAEKAAKYYIKALQTSRNTEGAV